LAQRRLRQGSDPKRVATDPVVQERTLAELGTVVGELEAERSGLIIAALGRNHRK
jgi:hypothetical protein